LDRGFVYAIAHIRGGGEFGRPWYDDGKMQVKKNTFNDFIQAAKGLIERGYTSPDRLAISGASAGGLLIGAVVNMAPELFRVAILKVPFVDCTNTMLDATIPLTVTGIIILFFLMYLQNMKNGVIQKLHKRCTIISRPMPLMITLLTKATWINNTLLFFSQGMALVTLC
jgi:alpha-beta hydrolase superfamily lysophospholipase